MIKFPSIEQFRNVIRHVKTHAQYAGKDDNGDVIYDQSKPIPTLKFRGTVKLHGTNAGIVINTDTTSPEYGTMVYQSRERELSLTSDNAGFMLYMSKHFEITHDIAKQAFEILGADAPVVKVAIFGEWCGSGIQKGVALTTLPKMFVVFAVKVVFDDETTQWLPVGEFDIHYPQFNIYNINTFPTYEIEIDFNHPELAQNKMIEITEEVEKECPVGKYFFNSMNGATVWLEDGKVCSDATLTEEVRQRCADVLKLDLNPGSSIKLSF